MVGQVERLGPKLDALGFPERDVFHKRKIEVCQAGADDSVASEIAVKSGIRQTKSAGIEVEVGSPQFRAGGYTQTAFRDAFHWILAESWKQVRAIPNLSPASSIARTIKPGVDGNRRAVGQSQDPVELPA